MDSLQIFVISWAGQHSSAAKISNKLLADGWSVTIIDSDPSLNPDCDEIIVSEAKKIRRPNNLFWADKFLACLEQNRSSLMLVIHADTHCDNWSLLVKTCFDTMNEIPNIGVWAPFIDNTPYHLSNTKIATIDGSQMHLVTETDGIIFCIRKEMVERLKGVDYSKNTYGWGIDSLFNAISYACNRISVVDSEILVSHSLSRGYDAERAYFLRHDFLKEHLSPAEWAINTIFERSIDVNKQIALKLPKID